MAINQLKLVLESSRIVIEFSHKDFESEVVEFKEAKSNYSFNDIGKYFSAFSNEVNIRGFQEAWLIFGISKDKEVVGTEFRKQGSLQN